MRWSSSHLYMGTMVTTNLSPAQGSLHSIQLAAPARRKEWHPSFLKSMVLLKHDDLARPQKPTYHIFTFIKIKIKTNMKCNLCLHLLGKPQNTTYRLGICQKIYTTKFSGKRILHTENALIETFFARDKQRKCIIISNLALFWLKLNSYYESLHLGVCKLAKYVRNCVVFWKNLHSWQKFYTTADRGSRDKFQVWICLACQCGSIILSSGFGQDRKNWVTWNDVDGQ